MKKHSPGYFLKSSLFVILLVLCQSNLFAQWSQVGDTLGYASDGRPSLAFNASTNEAYIAYHDETVNAFVVKKFNGTNWTQVGANLGNTVNVASPSLAFNPGTNEVYIAYTDEAANAYVVQKFDGTNWIQVGANFGYTIIGDPSLAFNPITNAVYIAYTDQALNAFVVKKFDGTNWTQVGANLGIATYESNPSLAFKANTNEAFIAYEDGALNAYVVQKFNGTNWIQVGASLGISDKATPSLAFSTGTNEAYIAYVDLNMSAFVVQKFNGTNWIQVGANVGHTSYSASTPSLVFRVSTNEAYVAYYDGIAHAYVVQKFDGTNWIQVGANVGYIVNGAGPSLAFNPCYTEAFMAYLETTLHSFVVQKFDLDCFLPVIIAPINQDVIIGNNAKFSVSTSYPCQLTYQWQTDAGGAGYQNITDAGQFSGATNDTLTVSSVTSFNNNQHFRCIVSSGSCSDTSLTAILMVGNTGINELANENNFVIYPNPANNILKIKLVNGETDNTLIIYDLLGKELIKTEINDRAEINITSLPNGIYIVKYTSCNALEVRKFIKE